MSGLKHFTSVKIYKSKLYLKTYISLTGLDRPFAHKNVQPVVGVDLTGAPKGEGVPCGGPTAVSAPRRRLQPINNRQQHVEFVSLFELLLNYPQVLYENMNKKGETIVAPFTSTPIHFYYTADIFF